jgi:BCL2-associated athanogene 3
MEAVRSILNETNKLAAAVDNFPGGSKTSREYLYLEEMLTRLLIRLDGVDTGGSDEVRNYRRQAVKSVQSVLEQLERKATSS